MDLNPECSQIKRNITNSNITIILPHDHLVLIKALMFSLENSGNIICILKNKQNNVVIKVSNLKTTYFSPKLPKGSCHYCFHVQDSLCQELGCNDEIRRPNLVPKGEVRSFSLIEREIVLGFFQVLHNNKTKKRQNVCQYPPKENPRSQETSLLTQENKNTSTRRGARLFYSLREDGTRPIFLSDRETWKNIY